MADLTDAPDWVPIKRLDTTDRVIGGPAGTANIQAQQLANRTALLAQEIDDVEAGLSALAVTVSTQGADNAVTNARLADVASQTIKGRAAVGSGDPEDLTVAQAKSMLGLNLVNNTADADKPVSTAAQAELNTKVAKAGDTMAGPLAVPAGASGAQVPQAQEVGGLASSQLGLAGEVAAFARNSAPAGWLKANGAVVSRTAYAALFTAIGTTFGVGDGATTFGLPDLRGEFPRGWDDGRGVDTGRSFGSAQTDAIKSHAHPFDIYAGAAGGGLTGGVSVYGNDRSGAQYSTNNQTGGATETRPRNIALLYCIKY